MKERERERKRKTEVKPTERFSTGREGEEGKTDVRRFLLLVERSAGRTKHTKTRTTEEQSMMVKDTRTSEETRLPHPHKYIPFCVASFSFDLLLLLLFSFQSARPEPKEIKNTHTQRQCERSTTITQ